MKDKDLCMSEKAPYMKDIPLPIIVLDIFVFVIV